jgi:hypothetical protein
VVLRGLLANVLAAGRHADQVHLWRRRRKSIFFQSFNSSYYHIHQHSNFQLIIIYTIYKNIFKNIYV